MKNWASAMTLRYVVACVFLLTTQATPTCYEYWEENCEGGVQAMYQDLTSGNCSLTVDGGPAWGTSCLTSDLVSLTQMEPSSCRKTYGSVQPASKCIPLGRREDRNVWLYCTNAGCDRHGKTCTRNKVETHGSVRLWDACGGSDVYMEPVPADGECYGLPDAGASIQVSCLNNEYMQVEVFEDQACRYESQLATAPTLLQESTECYEFQGRDLPFAMTVVEPCYCGKPAAIIKDEDVLRFDVLYNLTVSGSRCIEGNGLENFAKTLEDQTNTYVDIDIAGSALMSGKVGPSWWILYLNVRFQGVRQPDLTAFQEDFTRALDDGRVLHIIETTCGKVVDVAIVKGGSAIWESDVTIPPRASSSFPPLQIDLVVFLTVFALWYNTITSYHSTQYN